MHMARTFFTDINFISTIDIITIQEKSTIKISWKSKLKNHIKSKFIFQAPRSAVTFHEAVKYQSIELKQMKIVTIRIKYMVFTMNERGSVAANRIQSGIIRKLRGNLVLLTELITWTGHCKEFQGWRFER